MRFVDTHCHLFFEQLQENINEVVKNAKESGVDRLICVGTTLADSHTATQMASSYDNVWAAVGAHPHEAEKFLNDPSHKSKMTELLNLPKVVAVGEIGLDFYKNYSPKEIQEKSLRRQIEIGLPSGLPFIFHVRDAWSDFWRIFDDYKGLRGAVHSFSSGTKQLDAALSRGLYVGLNGIMTFTKDHAQLEAAKKVPLERLVLETDAPFLTPAPFRDQVCEPKQAAVTAEFLANLRGESLGQLSKSTTDNAVRLFGLE
ncbi:MAG: TatD family hydrolase [Candidatus Saccharimonadales bacterium]